MNKMIAGASSNGQGGLIKNHLITERKPNNNNRVSNIRKNNVRPIEDEDSAGLQSPDTRAEIPSNFSRFGGPPNSHLVHGFDGNMSIWNVNEDISFLNGNNNNPLEL